MNRGGPITVLLGLFIFGIFFGLRLLFWAVIAAIAIIVGICKLTAILWRRHKQKKLAREEQAMLDDPPMPVKKRVE